MDRLKLWLLPVYIFVGFIALLLVLPQSRWAVLNQVEAFSGEWRLNAGDQGYSGRDYLRPIQRGLEYDDSDKSPIPVLLRNLQPKPYPSDFEDYEVRTKKIFDYCMRQDTPEYLALFVRFSSFNAMIREDGRKSQPNELERRQRINTLVIKACEEGEKKDPQNAYFPLLATGARFNQGDKLGAKRDFLRASEMSEYKDYVVLEPTLRYNYLVDNLGYRGNTLRAWILMETLLQHVSAIRNTALHYAKNGNPEERAAAVRIGGLMIRRSKSLIGILVGRVLVVGGLNPTLDVSSGLDKSQDLVPAARQLEAQTHSTPDLTGIAEDVNRLAKSGRTNWPNEENIDVVTNMHQAWSAGSLLALLLLPFAVLIARIKEKSPRFAAISPYLVWVTAMFAEPVLGAIGGAGPVFGLTAFLFIPALFPKLRKFTDVAAVAVSVIGFGLMLPPLAFVIALLIERRRIQLPVWATSLCVGMVCLVSAGVWTWIAVTTGGGNGAIFGTLFSLALMCGLPAIDKVKLPVVAGMACVLLGSFYAVRTYSDISADRQTGVVSELLLNEANEVRQGAGI